MSRSPKGVERANEAIDCLIQIPKNDPLRQRAMEIVGDWVETNRDHSESLTQPPDSPKKSRLCQNAYQEFPVEVLPRILRDLVNQASAAMRCSLAYIALPMLTAVAVAIGPTRRLRIKNSWVEPAIVWTAIIGLSGSNKSAAVDRATKPIRHRQRLAKQEYKERFDAHQLLVAEYEEKVGAWKKAGSKGEPPKPPAPLPPASRYCAEDTTLAGLQWLHDENPRGVGVFCDELASWVTSFQRFTKSSDVASWLTLFGGKEWSIDRKGEKQRIHLDIPYSNVSVCGGIQPGIIASCLGKEHRENGLMARLLLAYPPPTPKVWTEEDIDELLEAEVDQLFDELFKMQMEIGQDGQPRPVWLSMTPAAKREWIAFYNDHNQQQVQLSGDIGAAWSKLEGYAARLALVIHCARYASGETRERDVDHVSMKAGITLSNWFGREAERVYRLLEQSPEDKSLAKAMEWIKAQPNAPTERDLQRGLSLDTEAEAESILNALVDAGRGQWQPRPSGSQGGRPTRVFILNGSDTTPERTGEDGRCVR